VSNPPVSLVPQTMYVQYWNTAGRKVVKIRFMQAAPVLGALRSLHMQEFGEALVYPIEPPNIHTSLSTRVIGLAELCNWLAARGFSETQQGEIVVGVCEAYLRSVYPDVDFDSNNS
jgi:hypothetical protein